MVLLIQNTQNRDSEAMHIKLDELIRAIDGAHNALLNLENLGERELDRIRADYIRLAEEAREKLQENSSGSPSVHPFDAASIISVVVPYPIHPLPLLLSATEGGEIEVVVAAD